MNERVLEQENIDDGITLVELFNAIKQNIFLLMGITLAVMIVGIIYTWYVVTPMYTSSVDIHISIENENINTINQVKNNVKEIVKHTDIIEVVVEDLEIPYTDIESTARSISRRVSSSDIGSSSAVRISYEDSDPVTASRIVIAIAEEAARRINLPKDSEEDSLAFTTEELKLINRPRENPNQAPSSPNKMLNVAISIILGGIIGVVIIILIEQFSSYFKTKKEVERATKISVLAMIPAKDGKKHAE